MVTLTRQRLEMYTLIGVCLSNRGFAWSKNRYEFFSNNAQWLRLVNLKPKPLEDKEVINIQDTRGCQYRKGRCIEDL